MLKAGDLAPEIDATTTAGTHFRLSEQPSLCTVVYFFPKAFTPGCTIETRRFRENWAELSLLGANVVGVSTDDHDTQCLFAQSMKTPFPMIGDADKKIARAYGVLWPILERAKRVTFVIDSRRRIASVIHHEVNIAQHRDEVLRAIDRMRRSTHDPSATLVDPVLPVIAPSVLELVREAGAGGMGTVYVARDRATDRALAVKVLGKDACRVRFAREIDVLSRLAHPNIVAYVDHGATDDGRTYLAMEWLDGESLSKRLARGPLELRESVRVVRDVCRGLAAAHALGVVHRDIKPSNVLVTRDGVVKVLDFGVALSRERVVETLTRTGEIVGTPGYMAPEQARSDRKIDARTDLFGVGCLLFRCVTGRRPFDGANAIALLQATLLEETPHLEGAPPALDALSTELLAKEMDDRPKGAEDVATRLDAILATLS